VEVRSSDISGEFQVDGLQFPVEFVKVLDELVVFFESSQLLLSFVVLSELGLSEQSRVDGPFLCELTVEHQFLIISRNTITKIRKSFFVRIFQKMNYAVCCDKCLPLSFRES